MQKGSCSWVFYENWHPFTGWRNAAISVHIFPFFYPSLAPSACHVCMCWRWGCWKTMSLCCLEVWTCSAGIMCFRAGFHVHEVPGSLVAEISKVEVLLTWCSAQSLSGWHTRHTESTRGFWSGFSDWYKMCVYKYFLCIYVSYLYGRLWQQYIRLVQSCKEVLCVGWWSLWFVTNGLKWMVLRMLGENKIMHFFLYGAKWSYKVFHD